jgi:hypothetical protein
LVFISLAWFHHHHFKTLAYLLRLQSVGYFVSVTPFDDYWVTVCLLSTICADFACWFPAAVQQLGFTMFVKLLVAKDSY